MHVHSVNQVTFATADVEGSLSAVTRHFRTSSWHHLCLDRIRTLKCDMWHTGSCEEPPSVWLLLPTSSLLKMQRSKGRSRIEEAEMKVSLQFALQNMAGFCCTYKKWLKQVKQRNGGVMVRTYTRTSVTFVFCCVSSLMCAKVRP